MDPGVVLLVVVTTVVLCGWVVVRALWQKRRPRADRYSSEAKRLATARAWPPSTSHTRHRRPGTTPPREHPLRALHENVLAGIAAVTASNREIGEEPSNQTDANGKREAKPAMAGTVASAFTSTPPPSSPPSSPPARPGMKMRYALIVIGLIVAGAIASNVQDNPKTYSSILAPRTQQEANAFDEWNTATDTNTPRFRRLEEKVFDRMGLIRTIPENKIESLCKYAQSSRRATGIRDYDRNHDLFYRNARTNVIGRC